MEFKIGDRVVVKSCSDNKRLNGKHGVIIKNNPLLTVKFDERHSWLHDGLTHSDDCYNRCWFVHPDDVELEETDVITIKRNRNVLIGFDNVNHRKAIAKCSPEDEFDLETGVKLVIDRLFPKEEPQYYTGKMVCVYGSKSVYTFTIGKIYEMKNGVLYDDIGRQVGVGVDFHTFEDFEKFIHADFLEVIE